MEKINLNNYEAYFLDFVEGNLDEDTKKEVLDFVRLHPELKEELEAFEIIELPSDDTSPIDWGALKKEKNYETSEELRDELFFKAAEGELSSSEENTFLKLIQKQEFKSEYELWQSLALSAQKVDFDKSELYNLGLDQEINKSNYEHFLIARLEGLLSPEQNEKLEKVAASIDGGLRNLQITDSLKLQAPKAIFFPDKDALYKKEQSAGLLIWFARGAAVAALLILGYFIITNYQSDTEPQYAERTLINEPDDQTQDLTEKKNQEEAEDQSFDVIKSEEVVPKLETQNIDVNTEPPSLVVEVIEVKEDNESENEPERINPEKLDKLQPNSISIEPQVDLSQELARKEDADAPSEDPLSPNPGITQKIEGYKTIPQLTEEYLASTFDLDSEEQGFLPTLGQKIADKAGEALNAEVRKDESEVATKYTFKLGGFKVTRTNSR